uniref:DC1 domain-containing protein n=1 Tax=Brassica oleracea var. oleracea TaxID=109376 RepID=A0A0D3BF21_BRAOL
MEHPPPSPFICPVIRSKDSGFPDYKIINGYVSYMIDSSCSLHGVSSHHGHRLDPLYWCNNKESEDEPSWCGACQCKESSTTYYFCNECCVSYHKECVESSPLIKSPLHPKHYLELFAHRGLTMTHYHDFCHQRIEENYGKYYCTKDCNYVVHSKCATRRNVWDGKELEEEPEEEYENLNSFEVIGDGIIQHFSHSHHMKFEKKITGILYYENKRCQACVLPFYGGNVYNCMDSKCDFVLHEACANLPRTKQHIAHPYPFILQICLLQRG